MLRSLAWLDDTTTKGEPFPVTGPNYSMSTETFDGIYRRATTKAREWSRGGRATPTAYAGILKTLAGPAYLAQPTPAPTKHYDRSYVEQRHQTLGR